LERDWVAAIVNKDLAALDRTLADDFVGTSVKGGVYGKTDAMSDIKNGVYVVQAMDMDEVSATVYGNAAVAFTSQDEKSTYLGKDSSGHFHFTNTWVKRNGKWQVVASHGSPYTQ
jgi:ketosteroid isomerase-like protein